MPQEPFLPHGLNRRRFLHGTIATAGAVAWAGTPQLARAVVAGTKRTATDQVTLGNTVMKSNARKVRPLGGGKVLAGFAGGTADAFTLFERFEGKLEKHGNLTRAAIEIAKDWRSDRYLRRLEALLLVGDREKLFVVSGNGDVIEPEHDLVAIGSGGPFAQAAARALAESTTLDARAIVERSLGIAADICIYTNRNLVIEELK